MNDYILSVVGVVLVSALLTAILPEGKTNGLIKSVAKVACVFTIVAPIINYFGGDKKLKNEEFFLETVINSDLDFIDYCSKISVNNAKDELEDYLFQESGVIINAELLWRYQEGETQVFGTSYDDRKVKIYKALLTANESLNETLKQTVEELVKKTGIDEVEFVSIN